MDIVSIIVISVEFYICNKLRFIFNAIFISCWLKKMYLSNFGVWYKNIIFIIF